LHDLKEQEVLANFFKTKAEPILYYLPEKLTDEMNLLIQKQKEDAFEARETFEKRNIKNDPLPSNDDTAMTDEE
jgi:tRNA isopentenyl-2-thiomethyl-A-37 hydroxylase MiaE